MDCFPNFESRLTKYCIRSLKVRRFLILNSLYALISYGISETTIYIHVKCYETWQTSAYMTCSLLFIHSTPQNCIAFLLHLKHLLRTNTRYVRKLHKMNYFGSWKMITCIQIQTLVSYSITIDSDGLITAKEKREVDANSKLSYNK